MMESTDAPPRGGLTILRGAATSPAFPLGLVAAAVLCASTVEVRRPEAMPLYRVDTSPAQTRFASETSDQPPSSSLATTGDDTHRVLLAQLLDPQDPDAREDSAAALQHELQTGRLAAWVLAHSLVRVALSRSVPDPSRGLALDVLAGARVPDFERLVLAAIQSLLDAEKGSLRVTAIAAATFLPRMAKAELRSQAEELARSGDARARSAAISFLREA